MKFNKNFEELINLWLKIYLIILGILWIILNLYLRFGIKRSDYILSELKNHLIFKHSIVFTFFVILHMILIITSIIILIKRNKEINTSSLFYKIGNKLSNIINNYYWKPLEHVNDLVAPHIPGSGRFFLWLEPRWCTKGFTYIMIFLFDLLPKLVLALIFMIEVVIFGRIYYFIYSLFLILIPILFNIFLKLFKTFPIKNIDNVQIYFISIKGIGDPNSDGPPITDSAGVIVRYNNYELIVKPEYVNVINPQEELELLFQLQRMVNIVVFTKDIMNKISPYVTLLTSTIYLIGGIYRAFYLFL